MTTKRMSSLKSRNRRIVRNSSEMELLQFGHEFGEYRLVRDALSKAVDRLKELGAGDDDDYLQSVISKLELMPD